MSTLPVANTLTSVLVPIGWAGAVFAILCAIVVLYAVARGAAGLTGGAIGVWFVGALLSVASSFASQWTPMIIAGGALAAALVVGGMVRMLTLPRPVTAKPAASVVPTAASAQVAKSQTVTIKTQSIKTQSIKTQPAAA
ncbi:hypothetical protein IM711_01205 [Microbacterium esteraromaticum]|uniref:hypothetical protein n=1 Tax=Microbacterium esteraromaticum TaxID=57043 RepID=UPI003C2C94EB